MDHSKLRVNGKRLRSLWSKCRKSAVPRGGVQRLTLTDEDKQARDLFVRWLEGDRLRNHGRRDGEHLRARPGKTTHWLR